MSRRTLIRGHIAHAARALALMTWISGWACNALTGVDDIDFAPKGTRNTCDPASGRGCREGLACRFSREDDAFACLSMLGNTVEPYAVCSVDEECPDLHQCLDGVCRRLCETADDCDWNNALCIFQEGDRFGACTRNCDLVASGRARVGTEPCGSGTRCDFYPGADGAGYRDCSPTAGVVAGAACATDADCSNGLFCRDQLCEPGCDDSADACAEGERCGGLVDNALESAGRCCTVPEGQACVLTDNCGCQFGLSCALADGTSSEQAFTECRDIFDTPVAPYAACRERRECPSGYSCIGGMVGDAFAGVCRKYCSSAEDCGSEGVACFLLANAPGVGYCARGCDVVSPQAPDPGSNACGAGTSCLFASETVTDCEVTANRALGDPCASSLDCAGGLVCAGGACLAFCALGGAPCAGGAECEVGAAPPMIAGRTIGYCPAPTGAEAVGAD